MQDETHGSVVSYARRLPSQFSAWKVACLRAFIVVLIRLDLIFLILAVRYWIWLAQGARGMFEAVGAIFFASAIVILALLGKFAYWFLIGERRPSDEKTTKTIERLSRTLTYHAIVGLIMFILFLFDKRLAVD